MDARRINRLSGYGAVALSLLALLTITIGLLQYMSGTPQAELCLPDEGTLAHIFQISIAMLLPTTVLFLATADWTQPSRTLRPLALAAAAVVVAFCGLYYGEHHLCARANLNRLTQCGRDGRAYSARPGACVRTRSAAPGFRDPETAG